MSVTSTAADNGGVLEIASRADATYVALRQAIFSCSLAPGSALTEAVLTDKYQVSKSTCRVALARLVQEGLIRSIPRQGYIVTPVTLKDVEELFALRLLLEPAAAKLAAGRADIRVLEQIETSMRKNTASRNEGNRIGFFLDANREFHMIVAMASGNARLAQNISTLLDEMKRLVSLGFVQQGGSPEICNDHGDLMAALKRGDSSGAEKIAARHVTTFRNMTLEKVMQSIRQNNQSAPLATFQSGNAR